MADTREDQSTILIAHTKPRLRVAIQGGGARVSYSLGALRELDRQHVGRIASLSCASSGAFAALALLSRDADDLIEKLYAALSSRRFINMRRIRRIVDMDYLVDDVLAPLLNTDALLAEDCPDIWVSVVNARTGRLTYKQMTPDNAIDLLRATNAFPILYGRAVPLDDGERYVDGGIGDPFPIIHALSLVGESDDIVVPIATKPLTVLEAGASPRLFEKLGIHLDRRIASPVRHRLLSPNPLVESTLRFFRRGQVGSTRIYGCEPSRDDLSYSRMTVDQAHLSNMEEMGKQDMAEMLKRRHSRDQSDPATSSAV